MRVVNLKVYRGECIYIGRNAKYWGYSHCALPALANPIELIMDGEDAREAVLERYSQYLWDKIRSGDSDVIKALESLKEDSVLGCWCKPKLCHGDIIVKAYKWYFDL